MKQINIKRTKVFSALICALSYIVLLTRNWMRESEADQINWTLFVIFIISLLATTFLNGKSNRFLITASVYFGVVLINTSLSMLLRGELSMWRLVVFSIPMTFFAPFAPIIASFKIFNYSISAVFLIIIVYGLLFVCHRLGKNQIKGE